MRPLSLRLVCLCASLLGCREPDSGLPGPAETSPNARIAPAPLLSGKSLVKAPASASPTPGVSVPPPARSAPRPYPLFVSPESEAPTDVPAETPAPGILLEAEFTWPGRTRPPQLHGLPPEDTSEVRASLARSLGIDLTTPERMRITLVGNGFPFPKGVSFLARPDREGHLLVWPDEATFRVVPPSALRALFRERRLDVTPTLAANVELGKKGTRFELPTQTVRVQTAHGELELEQARVDGLGAAGSLLCAFLLEFIAASTESVCHDDAVPLKAHYKLTPPGELNFSVKALKRKDDPTALPVSVPPPGAQFVRSGLPSRDPAMLSSMRRKILRPESADPLGVLTLHNPGPLASYVLLDDTPIAFVAPGGAARLDGLRHGDYQLSSLTWFGEPLEPPTVVKVPGRFVASQPLPIGDAGAP